MTNLDAKALRKAAEVLFDEFCPGVRLTEGDHDFYCERLEPAIRAYLDALPPAEAGWRITRHGSSTAGLKWIYYTTDERDLRPGAPDMKFVPVEIREVREP